MRRPESRLCLFKYHGRTTGLDLLGFYDDIADSSTPQSRSLTFQAGDGIGRMTQIGYTGSTTSTEQSEPMPHHDYGK